MENAKQTYDAFNRLWGKVPRHVRVDRENHQLMLDVRAFFDGIIETAKRAAIVNTALAAAGKPASGDAPEDVELPNPVHQALRLLRTLDPREWEMVKAIVDLHKFETDDFLDILDAIHDTHCPRCGEWLDDDDAHENCPVPVEDELDELDVPEPTQNGDAASAPSTAASSAQAIPPVQSTQPTVTAGAESELKIAPRE